MNTCIKGNTQQATCASYSNNKLFLYCIVTEIVTYFLLVSKINAQVKIVVIKQDFKSLFFNQTDLEDK